MVRRFESKEISAEGAGAQVGLTPEQFKKKLMTFKNQERARKRKKLSLMEQQVDQEEERLENDEELSDYEKMRLENMRRKLEVFQQLQIEMSKNKLAPAKPERRQYTAKVVAPRSPSARIKLNKEKKENQEQSDGVTAIQPEKLVECPVPAVPLRIPEILSMSVNQEVGKRVLAGFQNSLSRESLVKEFSIETASVRKIIKGATPGSIISSAVSPGSSNLLAFGDEFGKFTFYKYY